MSNNSNTTFNKRKIITYDIIQLFQWNVIDVMFVSSISFTSSIQFSSLLLLFNAQTFDIEQYYHKILIENILKNKLLFLIVKLKLKMKLQS